MSKENLHNPDYVTIDLKKYLYILYKNKKIILSIILIAIISSFLISQYIITDMYEAQTTIRLTNEENSIYSNGSLVPSIIKNKSYFDNLNEKYELNLEKEYINTLVSDNGLLTIESNSESPFIRIILKGNDPEKITNIVNTISSHFINETNEDINDKREILKQQINSLKQEKNNLSNLSKQLDVALDQLNEDEENDVLKFNQLKDDLFGIKRSINEYNIETSNIIYEIQNELSNITSAKLVNSSEIPENPSYPNTLLIVVITTMIAFFISIIVVFIKEIIVNTNWNKYEKE